MNQNQIEGRVKDIAGRSLQWAGEVTCNQRRQLRGAAMQVEGKVQKGVGDVERSVLLHGAHKRSIEAR